MDKYHLLNVFVAVVEEEGFSAAAKRLKMSPPAVTRAIVALEDQLNVQLLIRTTRVVRPTDSGIRYFEDSKRILASIIEADESAVGINALPSGVLSVTAPVQFGKIFVMPLINDYLARYPNVSANCLFVDRVVNFVDEGMDVGLRIGHLPDSSLKAIKVGHISRVVCATPAYLNRYGTPLHPQDLRNHFLISATGVTQAMEWDFINSREPVSVKIQPKLLTNTIDSAIQALLGSHGIARLLSYQVADLLAEGLLVRILDDYEESELPIHVIHREGRYGSAKVRSFVDMAVKSLRSQTYK
ncbi:MAG: LysR family transcriptional regulator [Methylophilaceae bacterium]|jgi:DNA-binding transcriptional LysR family regulator|nr:LysR family transcriptional regulator [Methyloradius sp.]